MHCRFGHPKMRKLAHLRQATGRKTGRETYRFLQEIRKHSEYWQGFGDKPKRFKFALRDEYIALDHTFYCDVITIAKKQVLNVVE